MKNNILNILLRFVLTAVVLTVSFSCSDWKDGLEITAGSPSGNPGSRTENEETRKVMLLYSAGYNSLTSYLKEDIEDLKKGFLPQTTNRSEDIVLVYSHLPQKSGKYDKPNPPVLFRLSRRDTVVVSDTLVIYDEGTVSASAEQLNRVLTYIKSEFPAKGYGMIFSSHATGYLPAGYYQNPEKSDGDELDWKRRRHAGMTVVPYVEPRYDGSMPMVKTIGQDQVGSSGSYMSYEIELPEFAEAIPMELDYLLFDACLMGGIEVAYELQDKVRLLGFSQTEVLAEGFCYDTLTEHLFCDNGPDVKGVCEDYFKQYEAMSGVYQSATISLIDCSKLTPLAEVCRNLFEKYRAEIKSVSYTDVQRFYRDRKHWFYDLESILINAGINPEEQTELRNALDRCVTYKAHTRRFMEDFDITTFCGFSMYLPNHGGPKLDEFYKSLRWNLDTGLVE